MNDQSYLDQIKDSFRDLIDKGIDFLPKLLVAALLLFVGYIIAKLVSKYIGMGLDYLAKNSTYVKMVKNTGTDVLSVRGLVVLLARWTILIIFIGAAVDVLELTVLTDTFQAIIDFVPNIFAAALIAGLSIIAGNVVYDIVYETAKNAKVTASGPLAMAAKIVVLVFGFPLAASQLGLDLSIINNNLTVVVAGVMLALGLAFGLGGKETAGKIVKDLYDKSK
ncbi:MAG: hypothetical protein M3P98_02215 [bacterium]|nr:hypothetical protein [bacterium]